MLVLSRQRDETIMIGDDVQITVVDIRGDKVRLGITAPRSIQVHRKEVYDAIQRENREAAKLRPRDVADVLERDAEKRRSGKKPGDAADAKPDEDSQKEKEKGRDNPNGSDQVGPVRS